VQPEPPTIIVLDRKAIWHLWNGEMDTAIRYPYHATLELACGTIAIQRVYRAFPPGTQLPATGQRCKVCFVIRPAAFETDERADALARLSATAEAKS
jgi:hypothetical protein